MGFKTRRFRQSFMKTAGATYLHTSASAVLLWICVTYSICPFALADETGLGSQAEAIMSLREHFEFEAVPLTVEHLMDITLESHWSYVLPATSEFPAVVFVRSKDEQTRHPVLLISSGRRWWMIQIGHFAWYWVDVRVSPDRAHIWAVLEWGNGDPGGSILLLHSRDGGWHWSMLSTIQMTWYQRHYQSLSIGPDGHGSLCVYLEHGDMGGPCPGNASPSDASKHCYCQGWDTYKTEDWGLTWSEPTFVHGTRSNFITDRRGRASLTKTSFDFAKFQSRAQATASDGRLTIPDGCRAIPLNHEIYGNAWQMYSVSDTLRLLQPSPCNNENPRLLIDSKGHDTGVSALLGLPYSCGCWIGAASMGYGEPEWAALLTCASDAPAEQQLVLYSYEDKTVRKSGPIPSLPSGCLEVDTIQIGKEGSGQLTLRGYWKPENATHPGLFIYDTADNGTSWTGPRFAQDIANPIPPIESANSGLVEIMHEATNDFRWDLEQGIALERVDPYMKPSIEDTAKLAASSNWQSPVSFSWDGEADSSDETALHFFALHPYGTPDLLKLMLDAGADVNMRTEGGATALDYAACAGRPDLAGIILAGNVQFNGASIRGNASLHWLATHNLSTVDTETGLPVVRGTWERRVAHAAFLLDHGVDPNQKNEWDRTPLHLVVEYTIPEKLKFVQVLLEHGADVNLQDGRGNTPLMVAVNGRNDEDAAPFVALLLDHGANPTTQDSEGSTALQIAEKRDLEKCVALIKDRHFQRGR